MNLSSSIPTYPSTSSLPEVLPPLLMRPASAFPLEALTDAYNQTRIDYIIPMPMNVTRLREYIHNYDVAARVHPQL